MGQALYRQYRPKSLGEVVGQEHITATLLHALQAGKLAHAYLFTGPRGVGKTSIARILAHEVNGLPYQEDATHLDIIEIDAASNRRIDEIRDLRDKVNIAPSSAKYKVYIIDEVHMLTREAFNALLKTLEEPPAHAVFILATTEAHKLPETIVSRTQRFIFRPVSLPAVAEHLKRIAKQEGIAITGEALELIAAHGEGSFRDSISLLDQTRGHNGEVTADVVRAMTGVPTDEAVAALCGGLAAADSAGLVRTLGELRDKGFAAPQVAKRLGQRLRDDVLSGTAYQDVFSLMAKLLEVPAAHDPEAYLELTLVGHALAGHLPKAPAVTPPVPLAAATPPALAPAATATSVAAAPAPASDPSPDTPAPAVSGGLPPLSVRPLPPPAATAEPPEATVVTPMAGQTPADLGQRIPVDGQLWPAVLNELKKTHNTLYGIVRNARPAFYQQGLELAFTFPFHKKRVAENKNKDIICAVIKQLTGQDISLYCVLVAKDAPEPAGVPDFDDDTAGKLAVKPPAADPALSAISDIFGSAEILEQ